MECRGIRHVVMGPMYPSGRQHSRSLSVILPVTEETTKQTENGDSG